MINPRNTSSNCFLYGGGSSQGLQIYGMAAAGHEGSVSSSSPPPPPPPPPLGGMNNSVMGAQYSCSLLYSFSVLKDKFHQVQSLISIFDQGRPESMAMVVTGVGNLIQEVIAASSSMLYSCQQMGYGSAAAPAPGNSTSTAHGLPQPSGGGVADPAAATQMEEERGQGFYSGESLDWFGDNYKNINQKVESTPELPQMTGGVSRPPQSPKAFDIVELEAEDLLAKYTHYCQVCGKGFKRDANLRMHMRAHGDEYKSNAALTNPVKNSSNNNNNVNVSQKGLSTTTTTNAIHHHDKNNNNNNPGNLLPRKYSCPQEGCRWNKRHAKFQPLKSMICVKNHYKRSHCPKMYICKRCNQKRFSVLSDLRTHEKHCGDLKWLCSCGTTFSRKDKLMGHVALFLGHTPVLMASAPSSKAAVNFHDQNLSQFQFQ